jgi:hypothetical protein
MSEFKLKKLIKEWVLENLINSDKLEEQFFNLNELKIDTLNSYKFEEIKFPNYTKSFQFEDRCGNKIMVVYIEQTGEFKTGYKVEGIDSLIFQPEKLDNVEDLIKPCADDKKINTVYKILVEEIIPNFLLNKKPNKLYFNPVSSSRNRLVDIITNKVVTQYPQLTKKNNYLVYL